MSKSNYGLISVMMIFVLSLCGGGSQDLSIGSDVDSAAIEMSLNSQAKNVFISYHGQRPDDALKASGVKVIRQYKYIPAIYASMPAENVTRLKGNPQIRFVEDEFIKYPGAQTLDWGLDRIDADYVHAASGNKGAGINVAVLDTGGDMDHPDLTWAGGCFRAKYSQFNICNPPGKRPPGAGIIQKAIFTVAVMMRMPLHGIRSRLNALSIQSVKKIQMSLDYMI